MRLFFLSLLFLPLVSIGQKIKESEIDKFTKQRRIETSSELLRNAITETVGVYYRSVDKTCFLNLTALNWSVGVVGDGEKLVFLLDNDSTVTAKSTGVQSYEISRYGNYYKHQYQLSKEDVYQLANHSLKSIRRYTSTGYTDLDIKDRKKEALQDLSKVFLEEYNKYNTM